MTNSFTSTFGKNACVGDSIETEPINGIVYAARIEQDNCQDYPWEQADVHGPVRKSRYFGRNLDKAPGERVLYEGNSHEYTFLYDWAGAVQTARDEWGCQHRRDMPKEHALDYKKPAPPHKTRGEEAVCAVQSDFDVLQAWLNDRWHYVGVVLEDRRVDDDDYVNDHLQSLWGIECGEYPGNDGSYLTEIANDLLSEELAERKAS